MKKHFLYLALGASVLTACTSEEVVDVSYQSNPISFENVVMKQSRAVVGDMTNANFDKFLVFGFYTQVDKEANPIQIFSEDAVIKNSTTGKWEYGGTRFWVPDATYSFFAYSCGDVQLDHTYGTAGLELNATGADRQLTISNYYTDASHQHDLIYAQQKGIKALAMTEDNKTPNPAVTFKFEHILTKIDAVFTSEFAEDYDVVIKDVQIVNFRNKGNFAYTKGWSDVIRDNGSIPTMQMKFSDQKNAKDGIGAANSAQAESDKPRTDACYVLPFAYATNDVTLNFTLELYKGTQHTSANLVLSRNMSGHWRPTWQQGFYYTYNVVLTGSAANLQPIVFETAASLNDWTSGSSTATDITFGT